MTGAGEHVDAPARPPPARRARAARPTPSSRPPTSTARPTASASRRHAELRRSTRSSAQRAAIHNDLQDAARSLCPAIDAALDAARAAGADHALVSGSGPDRRRPVRRRGRPGPRAEGHRRAGRARSPPSRSARSGRRCAADAPVPARRRDRPRRSSSSSAAATSAAPPSPSGAVVVAALALWGFGVVEPPNLTKLIEDVGTRLGKWTYLLVGALAFLETGAFVGLVAPGRERDPDRRRRRRSGPDLDLRPDRHRVGLRRGRRPHLLHARPPARPRLPRAPRPAAEDHRGAAALRRGLLRPPRRHHDPDRALHRPRPGDRAVHRRRVEDAAAHASSPYDVARRGPVGRRCSACSATSSGSRSTRSRPTSARAPPRSAGSSSSASSIWFAVRLPPRRGVPRQGPGAARAQPGVAARPRPADVRRRPRHASASSSPRCCRSPRVGTYLFFGLAVADRRPARSGSTRTRSTSPTRSTCRRSASVVRVATDLGSLAGHRRRRARHRDLGRAGTAARSRAPRSSLAHALTYVAVHVAKDATDRPRPSGQHSHTEGLAYPSGHAAYSIAYVACAIVLARGGHRWATRVGARDDRVVLAAAVAASRVYLRAHYLSDVIGGLALGTAIYALVGRRRARHRGGA